MKPYTNAYCHEGLTITVALEVITAERAKEYLATQKRNRKLRGGHLTRLLRDMNRGDWRLTAAGISFDESGALIDGQHRLTAISQSGVEVPLFVFRGFPSEAQDAVDLGAGRTVAEQLGMDGRENANLLTAYCNAIARGICGYSAKLSLMQVRAMLEELPQVAEAVRADTPKLHYRSANFLGVIAYALHIPGKAKEVAGFYDAFSRGWGISAESSPAYRAREWAREKRSTMGSAGVKEATSYMADCLQAWCDKEPMVSRRATGTGLAWLRTKTAKHYTAVRKILGFQG